MRAAVVVLMGALSLPMGGCARGQATRAVAAQSIPTRISDGAFWGMITELSEPGGYFHSDNFVSNELLFQHVIPELTRRTAPGGVYLGVGPEQNFTYIVAMRPRIAFILDIRRQNMVQHLMYKALIEMSGDRAEFLSRLFSRRRPGGLDARASVETLMDAYSRVAPESTLFRANLAAVKRRLVHDHKLALTADDLKSIDYVYGAFFDGGPELTYRHMREPWGGPQRWRWMPTFAQLMTETDGEEEHRSFLATEANFRTLRELEMRNLVVPLVGDFAGEKAIRAVGQYLKERGATVTAFYTSNVEMYLFRQDDDWKKFFTNVSTLPIDSTSTFIRAVFNFGASTPPTLPRARLTTTLSPIAEILRAFADGRLLTYDDLVGMSWGGGRTEKY